MNSTLPIIWANERRSPEVGKSSSHRTLPLASSLVIDTAGFEAWLQAARPGSPIEYNRGHLCVDRQQKPDAPDNEARAELHSLAVRVLRAADQGLVHLVQRRRGPADFGYLAIKTGKTPRSTHTTACPRSAG